MYYNIDFGSHELLSVILTLTMPSIGFHECLCIKDSPCNRILRLSENRIVLKHVFTQKSVNIMGSLVKFWVLCFCLSLMRRKNNEVYNKQHFEPYKNH